MGRRRKNSSGCSIYVLLFLGLVFIAYKFDTMSSESKDVVIIVFAVIVGILGGSLIINKINKNKKNNVSNYQKIYTTIPEVNKELSTSEIDESVVKNKRIIHSLEELKHSEDELGEVTQIDIKPLPPVIYKLPKLDEVFDKSKKSEYDNHDSLDDKNTDLEQVMKDYKVSASVVGYNIGPRYTQYEVALKNGTKINKLNSIKNEIALALKTNEVLIEPIPGKTTVGVEIPNEKLNIVTIRDILGEQKQKLSSMKIPMALGKDRFGVSKIVDVVDLPHLIVAGSTGTGKSVCLNALISTILATKRPDEVKLVLIDTNKVELPIYNGVPHLYYPVIVDSAFAITALKSIVKEIQARFQTFVDNKVKNITSYNEMISKEIKNNPKDTSLRLMPYIAVVIDDLSDLIIADKKSVEESIVEIAKLGRNVGVHIVLSTQRPSTNVVTGSIKTNIPSRIAFAVPSFNDSRTIIDMSGADKLKDNGDMLFLQKGSVNPIRIQSTFISDSEISNIVKYAFSQMPPKYEELRKENNLTETSAKDSDDYLYNECLDYAVREGTISASKLQRAFSIGFTKATKIIDDFEANGIVGPQIGSKPREVLVKMEGVTQDSEE